MNDDIAEKLRAIDITLMFILYIYADKNKYEGIATFAAVCIFFGLLFSILKGLSR